VLDAVALARSGDQAAAAGQLAALADSPDPLTAWSATAALMPWCWWNDEFTAAAQRVERTVAAVGPLAVQADLPKMNAFVTAFAAAAHYEGMDIVGPLENVLAALPAEHRQRRLFDQTWHRVVSEPASVLSARVPDPEPMLSGQAALAARGLSALSAAEAQTVMLEAINCGQRDLVLDWIDAGVPVPDRSWTLLWAAEMLLERGRIDQVESLLVRQASAWIPAAWWETTSGTIPVGIVTHDFTTPAVRRAHLEQPVAVDVYWDEPI
jgi:hypothetical protein